MWIRLLAKPSVALPGILRCRVRGNSRSATFCYTERSETLFFSRPHFTFSIASLAASRTLGSGSIFAASIVFIAVFASAPNFAKRTYGANLTSAFGSPRRAAV